MKKFLTIALLVMVLCVVSVAVSAAEITVKEVGEDNVVSVTVPAPETAGQTVVLVVKGTETDIKTVAEWEDLADKIIYVDQATAAGSKEFSFIPREESAGQPYTNKAVVFSSYNGNEGDVFVKQIDTTPVKTYTITLNANGGTGVPAEVSVKENASYTLPDPTRVGFAFLGWFDGETHVEVEGGVIAKPTGNKTVYAKWEAYFDIGAGEEFIDNTTSNEGNAVADAIYNEETGTYGMSVTTKISNKLEKNKIIKYGFYIYNEAKS